MEQGGHEKILREIGRDEAVSSYRFSLRFLFILVTLAALFCVALRVAFAVPIVAAAAVVYLPLFAMYAILRGPILCYRWRKLKQQYDAIRAERQSYLRPPRREDHEPPATP